MVADALVGKIYLIITKSASRFARNTVDSLTTIRKLKEHNVKCYFEKDYIKKRSYTTYWRFSCNIILYIVVLRRFLTLDIVHCRLNLQTDNKRYSEIFTGCLLRNGSVCAMLLFGLLYPVMRKKGRYR